tara:strand:+ start:1655 stop:2074 length:420 start_codon:yes stop_codon:yes gene_type:complete
MNAESIKLLNMPYKDAIDSGQYREWQDAESESFWYRYIHPWSKANEGQTYMILPDTGEFCIDDLYYDQAPCRGFGVGAFYTPEGLRHKEGWMCDQICGHEERKYSLNDLERMVIQNPHYHDTIKNNLIYNIKNREDYES